MDDMTPAQRRKNMRHIRSKDTRIEILLRKALWHSGIRYRKNYEKLPGKPDIAITKHKIAIFCDGEFFHGKDWDQLSEKLKNSNNSEYWLKKIERNIQRDREVDASIKALGWKVLRFWGKDIKKDIEGCIDVVRDAIQDNILANVDSLHDIEPIELHNPELRKHIEKAVDEKLSCERNNNEAEYKNKLGEKDSGIRAEFNGLSN